MIALLRGYVGKVRLFRRNARFYLLYQLINGIAVGIFSLLFNFYILARGYDQALLGHLLTLSSTAALIGALPTGYASDRLGRKSALLLAGLMNVLAVVGIVAWPTPTGLYLMSVLLGLGQSLGGVTVSPFLMENSSERERTYLFSFSFGVQMLAVMVGSWLGGQLPDWLGSLAGGEASAATTYSWTMVLVAGIGCLALISVLFIHSIPLTKQGETDHWAPFHYARQHPILLGKLILPLGITTMGAGLFVPFMNVFFRQTYHSSDSIIGSLFAAGSLTMALGLLLVPPLTERFGQIKLVILTQVLSVPFLVLLGFAPWFWLSAIGYLARQILINMTVPVYQAFVMERVEAEARATVAALIGMGLSFGYAVSPALSGRLQVEFGFTPVFLVAICAYLVGGYLYWRFFWQPARTVPVAPGLPL